MVGNMNLDENTFEVLSSETRREIIKALEERRMTVTELSEKLDLSKSTVYEHLSKLVNSGFIEKDKQEGRKWVYYDLTEKSLNLMRSRVKKVVFVLSSLVTGLLGTYELGNYFILGEKTSEGAAAPIGGGIEKAQETAAKTVPNQGFHLLAAIALFIAAVCILTYYWKKVGWI